MSRVYPDYVFDVVAYGQAKLVAEVKQSLASAVTRWWFGGVRVQQKETIDVT